MSKIKDVFFANRQIILKLAVLTLAWEDFSDGWIEGDGEEVDGDDGHEEDEELGEGAAGDEEYQFFVEEEILHTLHGHTCQAGNLTKKVES